MTLPIKRILDAGLVLEAKGDRDGALRHYVSNNGDEHPAIQLRIADIAQRIGQREIAFRMHALAAINKIVPSYAECAAMNHMPPETILMVDTHGWYGFSTPTLAPMFNKTPYYLIEVQSSPAHMRDLGITPDQLHTATHQGVLLFDAIKYEICVLLELDGPDQINPHDATHWGMIEPALQKAAALADYYMMYIRFYQPKRVVYSQGYMMGAAVMRLMAVAHGIPTFAIENTCLQDRLMCEDKTSLSVTHNSVGDTFRQHLPDIRPDVAQSFWGDFFAHIKTKKLKEHNTPTTELPLERQPGQKVFAFMGQVGTDSSILFSHPFLTQAKLIEQLGSLVTAAGHIFIVKLHPKEHKGLDPISYRPYNNLTLRKLQDSLHYDDLSLQSNFMIDRYHAYDSYSFVQQADVCITINSQIGLESACLGKPVITCGDCAYGGQGFTHDIRSLAEFETLMNQVISGENLPADPLKAQQYFYSYLNISAIEKTEKAFRDRILALADERSA